MLTALAGGVGAARFLRGLVDVVDPAEVTVVVNTGDDDEFHGLWVSPDLDSVTYTLADAHNPETGWGRPRTRPVHARRRPQPRDRLGSRRRDLRRHRCARALRRPDVVPARRPRPRH